MARYIAKFSKGHDVKFISHLDLMRCMQRAFRRAGIPVSYSKGFNPHADISFATPLPVGTASEGEYIDFHLEYSEDVGIIKEKLNNALPEGISIIQVREAGEGLPSLMSMVSAAHYDITLVNVPDGFENLFEHFLNMPVICYMFIPYFTF